MKEDDIENYFKFLELYKSFYQLQSPDNFASYVVEFINKYHKMQMRANFLQTRAT